MPQKFKDPKIQQEYNRFLFARLKYLKKWDARGLCSLFNNFTLKLPGSNHRAYWEKKERYTIPHFKAFDYYESERGFTELFRNQSMKEFYETIDKVLREEGIYDKVREAMIKDEGISRLYILSAPAWFRLREMGYSVRDLY